MKCGICQRNTMANSDQPPSDRRPVRRRPADERRQRAGNRADERGETTSGASSACRRQVDDERREREQRRERVRRHAQEHETGGCEQRRRTSARPPGRHAAVGQRTQSRPAHQRVGVALVHLIQHGGAAGDERGSARRCAIGSNRAGLGAEVVPGRARGDDERVQPRLGERDVVGERPATTGVRRSAAPATRPSTCAAAFMRRLRR